MITLYNFKAKKYLYYPDKYFLWYQVLPKGKEYVITKTREISGYNNFCAALKYLRDNKNIKLSNKKIKTWLDMA